MPAHTKQTVSVSLPLEDPAYYNVLLHRYVVEPGEYHFLLAASSQDVRGESTLILTGNAPYTVAVHGCTMIG